MYDFCFREAGAGSSNLLTPTNKIKMLRENWYKCGWREYRCEYQSASNLGSFQKCSLRVKMRLNVANVDDFRWRSHCRGLYHLPVASLELIRLALVGYDLISGRTQ